MALGSEPVRVGGEVVGRVTSGGYGYTVGASIAYAYLPVELAKPGTAVAVNVFGDWVGGEVVGAAAASTRRAAGSAPTAEVEAREPLTAPS